MTKKKNSTKIAQTAIKEPVEPEEAMLLAITDDPEEEIELIAPSPAPRPTAGDDGVSIPFRMSIVALPILFPPPSGTPISAVAIGSKFIFGGKPYRLVNNNPYMAQDLTGNDDQALPFNGAYVTLIPLTGVPQAQKEE